MTTAQLSIFLQKWFCGCGRPTDACEALRQILSLHPLWDGDNRKTFTSLVPDEGVQYLLLYTLDMFDLSEHGGGIGGAWLTDTGKNVLAALEREKASDDYESLMDNRCIHGNLCVDVQCPECA